ncbi:hypothetical protein HYV43_00670 [Candidatus Micrarchaeota archaeon]|nr:hypothetical protein [Candidatus Micrarchaeota archaeon]
MDVYPKVWLLLAVLLLPLATAASPRVLVYKNDACSHCGPYLKDFFSLLDKNGVTADQIVVKDYLNNADSRREVAELQSRFGVPLDMQGHMLAILDGVYVLEGHVPLSVVQGYLDAPKPAQPVIVYQDSMQPDVRSYAVLYDGKRQVYALDGQAAPVSAQDYSKYVIPAVLIGATGILLYLGLKKGPAREARP